MPWKESKPMDQRVQLIQDYEDGESISTLAEVYGVARKTVYKWLARHASGGVAGLADRSRAPLHCPSKLSEDMIAAIIAARQRWKWGPRKQ
jgi:transposase